VILSSSATVLCPLFSSKSCRVEIGLPASGMSCSVYGRIIPHIVCHDGNMFTTYQMHIDVLIMLRSNFLFFFLIICHRFRVLKLICLYFSTM